MQLEHGLRETVEGNEVLEELLGVDDHRPELEHAEWATADTGSRLREDNRPQAVEFDRGRDDDEQRRQRNERYGTAGDVDRALQENRDRGRIAPLVLENR